MLNNIFKLPSYRTLNILKYILLFFPAVVYVTFVYKYAQNAPRQDDYDAVLDFLNNFSKAGFADKLSLLFLQHNEHRMLFSRMVFVAYYTITGSINFRALIFINVVVMLLIVRLCIYFSKKLLPAEWPLAAIAFSLCLFNINSYENSDFAMAGCQNFGVFLLFLGSMFFYSKHNKKMLPFAALLQIICSFSGGNGNIGVFFLVLYTLLNKDKYAMLTSVSCFIIFAPLYYYHYHSPGTTLFTSDPAKFLPFFFHALGAHALYKLSMVAGIVMLIAFVWLAPISKGFKIKTNTLPFLCTAGFVFGSLAVMAVFRGNQVMENAYASRYFVHSNLMVAILAVLFVLKTQGYTWKNTANACMILFLIYAYARNVKEGRHGFEYIYNNIKSGKYDYPDPLRAKNITDESCRMGIYCI